MGRSKGRKGHSRSGNKKLSPRSAYIAEVDISKKRKKSRLR